jgi:hypothetical protein
VGQHQRRQQAPHGHGHGQRGAEALGIEEVRQHHEEAQEEQHHRVATGAQF